MPREKAYSKELAQKICYRLEAGESLSKICREEGFPTRQTINMWLKTSDEFLHMHAHARQNQADFFADQCIDIADDESRDMYLDAKTGGLTPNNVAPRRDEQRIKSRQWFASVTNPKKYGLRNQNTVARLISKTASDMADEIIQKYADGDMSIETANESMKLITAKMNIEQGQELMQRLEQLEKKTELL